MVSVQNLELELQNLLKEKKYSEIIFNITTKTKEEERNAGLFVLLGISRISLNKKNKDQVCLLYTSPSPRDKRQSRMPSSA